MSECSIDGCNRSAKTRGYCNTHYLRWWKKGSATAEVQLRAPDHIRFWNKVERTDDPDECWHWKIKKGLNAYGQFRSKELGPVGAHRFAFYMANGFLPVEVMHTCDVRSCVNPNHLRAGTRSENMQDMNAKGRGNYTSRKRGAEHHGAKLTEDDIRLIRSTEGNTSELARKYGVCRTHIQAIRRRIIWRHVP
jgi:hypothetical protein